MSSTDERIVQMQFDNKQFEKNVETSRSTIKQLKNDLNFDGAVKSLENLDKAGRNFSLESMGKGIDGLNSKFSALGIMGITVIQNLTNSILNMSKRFMESLTIDPVKTGLEEYETKMNAIQTILTNTQSKGTTLDDVNKALAELNEYSDKTIYNFSEMTRNIGTFTAAGVALEDSTEAIKGIANIAAGSGSNAQQASTAMYQLSQALAAGKVQLMDWNSVVNAGMGGELFKQGLIDTAKELGIATPAMKDFRESLKDGWVTSEVLLKTLQKFAKDESLIKAATEVKTFTQLISTMKETVQSGWALSWEKIIGDKDTAAKLFTGINDAFSKVAGAAADARNKILEFWNVNGGRDALIEGIAYALIGLADVMQPIEEAFRTIFPPMTGEKLVKLTEGFRDLMKGFKMGEGTSENIKRTFQGLFALLDIGAKAFTFIAKCIGLVVKALAPGAGGLLSITGGIGDFLVSLNDSVEKTNFFGKALQKVGGWIKIAGDNIAKAVSFMSGKFGEAYEALQPVIENVKTILGSWGKAWGDAISNTTIFSDIVGGVKDTFSDIADALVGIFDKITGTTTVFAATTTGMDDTSTKANKLKTAFEGLHTILSKVWEVIKGVAKSIKNALSPIFEHFKKMTKDMDTGDVGALFTGGGFLILAKTLSSTFKSVDNILGSVNKVVANVATVFKELGKTLKAFQMQVKAKALLQVAIALGILAAALVVLSLIPGPELAKSLGILSLAFIELVAGLTIMNNKIKSVKSVSGQLVALGAAMLLLAFSVKVVSSIDSVKLLESTAAIMSLMLAVGIFIQNTNGGDLKKSASGLFGFAAGIMVLSLSLAVLGKLRQETLMQGAEAIGALMLAIMVFINMTRGGDLAASAGGLIGFAVGINILAGALAILGKLKFETLMQGAKAIGALMLAIAVFINMTRGGDLAASAGGLIGFSVGLTILVGALVILGNLDFTKLIQGGAAILILMSAIARFIQLTNGGDLALSSAGIIGFAVGLTILANAVSILAKLDFPKLLQGTIAISALMVAIANFVRITPPAKLLLSSAGIIGFAAGITILAVAVSLIAALNPNKVVQGFTVIAGLMAVLGVFIKMTSSGDLVKSSAGIMTFSIGILVLAGAIAILSALNQQNLIMSTTAISALILTIGLFIKMSNGGKLAAGVAGMLGFAAAIAIMSASLIPLAKLDSAQLLAAAGAVTMLMVGFGLFTRLLDPAKLAASGAAVLIMAAAIVVLATSLTILGGIDFNNLVLGFGILAASFVVLGAGALILGPLAPTILALAASIAILGIGILAIGIGFQSFATGLAIVSNNAEPFKQAIIGMLNLIPLLATKIGQGVISFATAIKNGMPSIIAAATAIASGLITVFTNLIPKIAQAVVKMVLTIMQTLAKYAPQIVDAGLKLLTGLLQGISNNIGKVVKVASDIIIKFLNGIASKLPNIIKAGVTLIVAFIKGIGQEAPRLIKAGFQLMIDFINGLAETIREKTPLLVKSIMNLGDAIIDGIVASLLGGLRDTWDAIQDVGQSLIDGFKSLLGINSPSKVFADFGGHIVTGLVNGIGDNISKAINSVKQLGGSILDKAREVLGIHSPSTMMREMGENLIAGLTNGITENTKTAVDASADMSTAVGDAAGEAGTNAVKKSNEAAKSAYDKAVEWIDERKYYNKLSLEEELKAWQTVQAKYANGSEERKKIDREVYRVRGEIRDRDFAAEKKVIDDKIFYDKESTRQEIADYKLLQKEYKKGTKEREEIDKHLYELRKRRRQEDFNDEKQVIDDAKYYDQMSTAQELAAWEVLQAKYKEGTDERKEADREVYRLHKEITEQLKSLDEEYYANQKELTDKQVADIQALNDAYTQAVKDRSEAIYNSYGLFDKVETPEAVSGYELITNLQSQVDAMDAWTAALAELGSKGVDSRLMDELSALGPSALAQVQALNTLNPEELATYVSLWAEKHRDALAQATTELDDLKTETSEKIDEINTQTALDLDELKKTWEAKTAEINGSVTKELENVKTTFKTSTEQIVSDTKTAFETTPNWSGVGVNIMNGIISGIRSKSSDLINAAAEVAISALTSAKDALGIHSPSKEFAKVGMYADEGFAEGLQSGSKTVASSAEDVGNNALNSMSKVVSKIVDSINNNIDSTPTIRPVLDLSDVEAGGRTINGLFSKRQGINVSAVTDRASRIGVAKQPVQDTSDIQNGGQEAGTSVQFVQNNYSPKPLSRIEIYRQTKNQISTLKGLVSTT